MPSHIGLAEWVFVATVGSWTAETSNRTVLDSAQVPLPCVDAGPHRSGWVLIGASSAMYAQYGECPLNSSGYIDTLVRSGTIRTS